MPSQSWPPAEEYPTIHCATHEKPFPCPDCVAARSPSQSLPDGVEVLTLIRRGTRPGGSTRPDYIWWQEVPTDASAESVRSAGYQTADFILAADRPKIEEQAEKRGAEKERERLRKVAEELLSEAARIEADFINRARFETLRNAASRFRTALDQEDDRG